MTRHVISIASLGPAAQAQVLTQLRASQTPPEAKPSKYRNHKTAYRSTQGFERVYDSKREARYAADLDLLLAQKLILWWLPQVRMPLPGGVVYVVDFQVCEQATISFIDVKGKDTQASINKRKQVKALYGIDVEVMTK